MITEGEFDQSTFQNVYIISNVCSCRIVAITLARDLCFLELYALRRLLGLYMYISRSRRIFKSNFGKRGK